MGGNHFSEKGNTYSLVLALAICLALGPNLQVVVTQEVQSLGLARNGSQDVHVAVVAKKVPKFLPPSSYLLDPTSAKCGNLIKGRQDQVESNPREASTAAKERF